MLLLVKQQMNNYFTPLVIPFRNLCSIIQEAPTRTQRLIQIKLRDGKT